MSFREQPKVCVVQQLFNKNKKTLSVKWKHYMLKFCKYLEQYLDIYAFKLSYAPKHHFNIWLPESSNLNITNFLSLVYFIP